MIYKVKNCIMYDGSRKWLLFTVENGVSRVISDLPNGAEVKEIDAKGAILLPAFTDIGAKCYDKCRENSESLETASAAASVGGYRRIVTLGGNCFGDGRVITAENVSEGAKSGIVYGFYGDGDIYETLCEIKKNDALYISAGIKDTENGGFARGIASKMSGTVGFSRYDECGELGKLLFAAYETGARVHVMAIGCREALEMVKSAKKAGAAVTVGVSPFHLALTENDVAFYGANCKLLPPLRSSSDREALREGLFDGSIDTVSSLHTPLSASEKNGTSGALYGLCSIETTIPVLMTYLQELEGKPRRIAEIMALKPSEIIGEGFSLREGESADFVLVDPSSELVISSNTLKSKCSNTPFLGQTLLGCNLKLYLNGKQNG